MEKPPGKETSISKYRELGSDGMCPWEVTELQMIRPKESAFPVVLYLGRESGPHGRITLNVVYNEGHCKGRF